MSENVRFMPYLEEQFCLQNASNYTAVTKAFWTPEHDVSPSEARRLITRQFPHVAAATVERFGSGMDNIAYLVDEQYVFRFPRRAIVVELFEHETSLLPLIAPHTPVPVPLPRFVGVPQDAYPWMFAGYERLPGMTTCTVALSDEQRTSLATPLGAFLHALHSIDPQDAIAQGLPHDTIGRLDHTKRFPLAQERLAELESTGYIKSTESFIKFMRDVAPPALTPSVILHGDLYARHLLVDETGRLSGVIDWGDVHFGHPASDLMVAHTMLPASAQSTFIQAYGGVDDRTWQIAKYRAIYHSALVAHYGIHIEDVALRNAGLTALERIRPTL